MPPALTDSLAALRAAWPVLVVVVGLLLPGVRERLRAFLQPRPRDLAADVCGAWEAAPAELDQQVLASIARNPAAWKAAISVLFADEIKERQAMRHDLRNIMQALVPFPQFTRQLKRLNRNLTVLGSEFRHVRDAVVRADKLGEANAGEIAGTREDVAVLKALYSGENDRRRTPGTVADRAN